MKNEVEQIALQNDMSIEFVTWFFNEKKAGCGNVWFMMMAAMWEGWKGRSIEMDKLAAENVEMKQIIDSVTNLDNEPQYHDEGMGCGLEDRGITDRYDACRYGWDEAMERIYGEVIPCADELDFSATDAYLAWIKADGVEWIEGNEPSEFGRYWVRYETDTGPQYCSAKWMEYNFCASSDTNIHKIWLADHSRSINSLKGVTHYTKLPAALEGGAL
ncbi:TPA: hypothetical protein ACTW7K_001750 [Klebsiella pneumoniae]|uniref:hypothetical protein n=1 Tax=Klebsiella pneumoniae TaxID=573 RepID=UPI0007CC8A6E|nr:hypothetical protein [Klebsiella pneumoniae]SAT52740.1 Uncharacterised protein [Klebsiella pneumoniae]